MRILLVEDDALLGDGAKAGLAQAGFAVDWVKDGVAAELALKTTRYAAVVLDLGLPRLSGLQVLESLRDDPRNRLLPVVILTSSDEERDVIEGYSLGANSYVRKPVDFVEFTTAAQQLGLYWLLMNRAPPVPRRL